MTLNQRTITPPSAESLLLDDDSDVDGDTLTLTGITSPTNGSVALVGNTVTYTPTPNTGTYTETLTYTVSDGTTTSTGTLTITVNASNDAPVAVDDTETLTEDDSLTTITVLDDDTDADGDSLTVSAISYSGTGTAAINADNARIDYTPAANFNGTDTITYTVSDGTATDTGTLTIIVNAVDDAPTVSQSTVSSTLDATINEDSSSVTINVLADLGYTADADGDPVSITAVQANAGAGSVSTDGSSVTYTPAADYSSPATITFTASDGTSSFSAFFTISFNASNDAPVAVDDTETLTEDDSLTTITVLDDDTDADGDSLTVSAISYSGTGTAAINADNARIDYTPAANFNGTDTITYTVSDGTATDTGTLTIIVNAVDDAPTVSQSTVSSTLDATINEDSSSVTINVLADLGYTADADGDSVSITAVQANAGAGSVSTDGSSVTYTPAADYSSPATITFTASDGTSSFSAFFTISFNASNDAPVAVDDTETLTEDDSLTTITVLDDDTDADGDSLTVSAISYSGTGTAAINADNARIDYTPAANFNGTDTITYTVSDGTATDTGTLTIIVNAVNDAPVAVDDAVTTKQDSSVLVAVLANDTHADSSVMSIVTVTSPSNGTVTQDGSVVTYTPNSSFSGSDTFAYTVQDANGVSDTANVTVTVNATATACSPTISALGSDCTITPTNHKMTVLAFGLCTSAPTRPTTATSYDISSCQLIYDGRSSGGAQVSVAGGGTQSFVGNLTIPPYGTYTHGIMLIDNSFTVQGELVLDASAANRYCYIETGMTVACYATQQTPADVTDTVGNFFDLSPAIYSYSFTADNVTVDLVTNESAASTLSASDATSDAILAIQTFGSPTTFDESTRSLDIGVKISEAVVVGSGGADTSPFSIRFSVE